MGDLVLGLAKSVVEGALTKAQSAIGEEAKLRQSVQNDLVFITGEFEMMQSFLNATNEERVRNNVVRTWVRQVRDLAYDVEDCIEFVVHLDKKPSWWFRMLPSCMAPALPLDEAVADIKQLKARVEDVSHRNARYNLITDSGSKPAAVGQQQPMATAGTTAFDIVQEARDTARKNRGLVNLTELIANTDDLGLQVISLWGTGGDLGTTSIIKKAYDGQDVRQAFRCRGWAKLTRPFNPHEFLRSLLTQLSSSSGLEQGPTADVDTLTRMAAAQDELVKDFVKQVEEKRYLVVLEGLSTVVEWETIRMYLPDKKNGSRIVVSTQQLEIASLCTPHPCGTSELTQLSADHSVCVFYSKKGRSGGGTTTKETIDQVKTSDEFKRLKDRRARKNVTFEKMKLALDNKKLEHESVERCKACRSLYRLVLSSDGYAINVISVWGISSVGKSALVKDVYYTAVREPWFERCGWVDVSHSQPFDLREFSRSLLSDMFPEYLEAKKNGRFGLLVSDHLFSESPEALVKQKEESLEAAMLGFKDPIEECCKLLRQERCLVVIDGLQSTEEWDLIKAAFVTPEAAKNGTCIVVIANVKSVATHCSMQDERVHNVKSGAAAALDLFEKEVFKNAGIRRLTTDVEKQQAKLLVDKCGGLPIVIAAICRFLATKLIPAEKWWEYAEKELRGEYAAELRAAEEWGEYAAEQWREYAAKELRGEYAAEQWREYAEKELRGEYAAKELRAAEEWSAAKKWREYAAEQWREYAEKELRGEYEAKELRAAEEWSAAKKWREYAAKKWREYAAKKWREYAAEQWREYAEKELRELNDSFMHELETNPRLDSLRDLFTWMHSYFRSCPDYIKPCIFYLSIFPPGENTSIRRRRLVRRWIAEGYSRDMDCHTAEEKGETFFSELVGLSIIQHPPETATATYTHKRMVWCQVNGFFREYISSRPMEDNLVFALEGRCSVGATQCRQGRHLTIRRGWDRDPNVYGSIDFSRLRSLTVFGEWSPFFVSEGMRLLRVLDLEDTSGLKDDDLEQIGKLVPRLKFLSVRGCREVHRLPDSLGGLTQLETLDARYTSVAKLPTAIVKLQKLQYLRAGAVPLDTAASPPPPSPQGPSTTCPHTLVPSLSKLRRHPRPAATGPPVGVEVPRGGIVGKMTTLHTLGVVDVSVAAGQGKAVLKEVKNLTQMRKLGVSGINPANSKELWSAISGHGHLECLSVRLEDAGGEQGFYGCSDGTVFSPPEKLQSLKLHGLVGTLPAWTKQLQNLSKLNLHMTILKQEDIYVLGDLPNLRILRLCLKPVQDGNLHFRRRPQDDGPLPFKCLGVLEIAYDSRLQDVTFGAGVMGNLELLKVPSSLRLSGIQYLGSIERIVRSNM